MKCENCGHIVNCGDSKFKVFGYTFLAAIIISLGLFLSIWASGGTFGARCDAVYGKNTPESRACVTRLVKGEPIDI